jgi:hypothetical protein
MPDRRDDSTRPAPALASTLRGEARPLLAIALVFAASSLVLSPLRDVAVSDDWTYAWTVEHLLRTGRLAVLDWSAHYAFFPAVWAGLFSAVFGFSFGILRVSTLVLAALGGMAFYLTLRELEIDRSRSLLGALALVVNPIYFLLSFSFMTDVPFLSAMNLAVFFYVAGVKRDRPGLLWMGGVFAVAAFLSRQIGAVIPLALAPCVARPGASRAQARLLPLVGSLAAMAVLWRWEWTSIGPTSVMAEKMSAVHYLLPLDVGGLLKDGFLVTARIAFYFAPLLLAALSLRRRRLAAVALVAVASALVMRFWTGSIPAPLGTTGTWSLYDLGDARTLVSGDAASVTPPRAVTAALQVVMLVCWSILVAGTARAAVRWWRRSEGRSRLREAVTAPGTIVIALGLLHLGVIHALWFYYDRYYLALFPAVIYVALKTAGSRLSIPIAAAGTALLAVAAVAGTWDNLRFEQAKWDAYRSLRARGVAAADIDAGYAINGWMLYAHPENLHPGQDPRRDVPWVTSAAGRPYAIARSALAGFEVLEAFSWRTVPWAPSSTVYVLRKPGASLPLSSFNGEDAERRRDRRAHDGS